MEKSLRSYAPVSNITMGAYGKKPLKCFVRARACVCACIRACVYEGKLRTWIESISLSPMLLCRCIIRDRNKNCTPPALDASSTGSSHHEAPLVLKSLRSYCCARALQSTATRCHNGLLDYLLVEKQTAFICI